MRKRTITVDSGKLIGTSDDPNGKLTFYGIPVGKKLPWGFTVSVSQCDNVTEIDPPRQRDAA